MHPSFRKPEIIIYSYLGIKKAGKQSAMNDFYKPKSFEIDQNRYIPSGC